MAYGRNDVPLAASILANRVSRLDYLWFITHSCQKLRFAAQRRCTITKQVHSLMLCLHRPSLELTAGFRWKKIINNEILKRLLLSLKYVFWATDGENALAPLWPGRREMKNMIKLLAYTDNQRTASSYWGDEISDAFSIKFDQVARTWGSDQLSQIWFWLVYRGLLSVNLGKSSSPQHYWALPCDISSRIAGCNLDGVVKLARTLQALRQSYHGPS